MGFQQQTCFKMLSLAVYSCTRVWMLLSLFSIICLMGSTVWVEQTWLKLMFSGFDSGKVTGLVHSRTLQTLAMTELKACKTMKEWARKDKSKGKNFWSQYWYQSACFVTLGPEVRWGEVTLAEHAYDGFWSSSGYVTNTADFSSVQLIQAMFALRENSMFSTIQCWVWLPVWGQGREGSDGMALLGAEGRTALFENMK